jgi:hypothetical protein
VVDAGPAKGEVYYSDEEDEDEESRAKAQLKAMEQSGMTRREKRKAAVGPSVYLCVAEDCCADTGRNSRLPN